MNDFRYIFSWLLIVVGFGIGWYMCYARSKDLAKQRLETEAKCAKFIGYSYMIGSFAAMIIYRI